MKMPSMRPFDQTGGLLTGLSWKSDDIPPSIQQELLAHQMVLQKERSEGVVPSDERFVEK